jgi:hypothetical protein
MPTKHRFDGKWYYFQIRDGIFPPEPLLLEEAVLVIPDKTNGKVEPSSSTIHGKRITSGTADPKENTLDLVVEEPGNNTRTYKGERIKDFPGGGQPLLVIIGRFLDVPLRPLADAKRGVKAPPLTQDEGTWVIIK